jgi:hypothetical protein
VASAGLASLALLAAGCGASKSPSVASLETTTSSGAASGVTATSGPAGSGSVPSQAQSQQDLLKYAQCMRSNGMPNFPDPSPSGGFRLRYPPSAAFKAAQPKCQKLLPAGGMPAPGSTTHPSAQSLAQMLKVAQCMRGHGISGFPDPRSSIPSNLPAGGGTVMDQDGVILVFPAALNTQSPLYLRTAAACRFQLTNH